MTGTKISYYFICHRELWFFCRNIKMEQNNEMGIDFYDNKNKIIHKVKKSNKMEETHICKIKFYFYVLAKKVLIVL